MCKRLMFLMSLVVVLGLVSNASAFQINDWRGPIGGNWNVADNWTLESDPTIHEVPHDDHSATFDTAGSRAVLDSAVPTLDSVSVGYQSGDTGWCDLEIRNGAELTTVLTDGGRGNFLIGVFDSDMGRVTMTGGVVNIDTDLGIAVYDNSIGELYLSGGTINVGLDMGIGFMSTTGYAYMKMTGGTVTVEEHLAIGPMGPGHLDLHGGTIWVECINKGGMLGPGFSMGALGGAGTMDITLGTLVIGGDVVAQIEGYVASGLITAYDGYGEVHAVYHPGWDKTVVNAVLPEPATIALLGLGGLALLRRRR